MDIELLTDALDRMGVEYDERVLERMKIYMSEIMLFNPTYRLVAQSDEDEILIRHFLDSASAVPYLKKQGKKSLIDLGTGAGFPGIILAILMPEMKITLSERMSRRISFLKNVILRLKLENVTLLEKDAKDVEGRYDIVTSRAFHPLYDCMDYVLPLVSEGGIIAFYKGPEKNVRAELDGMDLTLSPEYVRLNVPYLDEMRTLLVLR